MGKADQLPGVVPATGLSPEAKAAINAYFGFDQFSARAQAIAHQVNDPAQQPTTEDLALAWRSMAGEPLASGAEAEARPAVRAEGAWATEPQPAQTPPATGEDETPAPREAQPTLDEMIGEINRQRRARERPRLRPQPKAPEFPAASTLASSGASASRMWSRR